MGMDDSATASEAQPERITGIALERALWLNILAGTLGVTCFSLISGIYLTSFAEWLGLTKFQFGVLGAVPMLVFPARLYASLLVERLGHRKRFFIGGFAAGRAVWVLVILLPFVISPEHRVLRTGLFLFLLLASNGCSAMAAPVWFSYMGDLVPETRRGQFWARRNALVTALPRLPVLAISFVFDHLRDRGHDLWAYVLVFGFAVLVGELDLWIHAKIPDLKMKRVEGRPSLRQLLAGPLRQANFRRFLYYIGCTTFSALFLGHFTNLYLLNVLKGQPFPLPLGFTTLYLPTMSFVAAVGAVNMLLVLLLSRTWGYLIDRFGSKPVLRLTTLILVPLPLAWLFITPEHPYAMTIPLFIVAGVTYGAKDILITNLLYAVSPRENRTMYVAVHGVVFGIFGAVSPILAGVVMSRLGDFTLLVGGIRVEAFHVLCVITVGARVVEQYLLGGFEEPASTTTAALIRRLARANPFVVLPQAFAVLSSAPVERKVTAARQIAHSGSQLATRDLVGLLEDPSPEVRKEAALALGRTKDEEAVPPLMERLTDIDVEMRRQAAWALGQIGSADATDQLMELLADPYPHVRSAAALALGQLGGTHAVEALMDLLQTGAEPVEFASAATALGLLGHAPAMRPILERLHRSDQPVFRRQLAVAVGDLLDPSHSFYSYLDEETKVHGRRATRSLRALRRLLRKQTPGKGLPSDLEALVERVEATYLGELWPDCARALAELRQALLASGLMDEAAAGLPGELLQRLCEFPGRVHESAGFENCVLGLFALDQLAAKAPPAGND